VLVKNNWHKMA